MAFLEKEKQVFFVVQGPIHYHPFHLIVISLLWNTALDFVFYNLDFFFLLFRAAPAAYGSSQGRGPIGATAASLRHSNSNAGSELCLRTTPQLTAHGNAGSLTH